MFWGKIYWGQEEEGGKTESRREHSPLTLEMAFVSRQCSLRFLMGTSPWKFRNVPLYVISLSRSPNTLGGNNTSIIRIDGKVSSEKLFVHVEFSCCRSFLCAE